MLLGGAEDFLGLGAVETRFFIGAFSLFSSVVAVLAAETPDELWPLSLPRVGFVGTVLRRLAVELAKPSSSLTADLAMLCLRSELLVISSVVLDFIDDGVGLVFLGFLLVDNDDDDDGTLGWVKLVSFLRFEGFVVSTPWELRLVEVLTDDFSFLLCSFSELSHGLSAIHLSNQLQPQVGLLGSMNIVFPDLMLPFKCCYKYEPYIIIGSKHNPMNMILRYSCDHRSQDFKAAFNDCLANKFNFHILVHFYVIMHRDL